MGAALNMYCSAGGGGRPPAASLVEMKGTSALRVELRKVLVVDDERDLADLAQALLCCYGIEARVAYSAAEALQVLEQDPEIDALFSDVMMPGMTGLELADRVSCRYPSVKVVLTSGFTAPALMAGHRPYLYAAKPYGIETVLKLLRS